MFDFFKKNICIIAKKYEIRIYKKYSSETKNTFS